MKEELCEKVVEVRRKSDKVIRVVMVLEEEGLRIICVYAPQSGRESIFMMILGVSGIFIAYGRAIIGYG